MAGPRAMDYRHGCITAVALGLVFMMMLIYWNSFHNTPLVYGLGLTAVSQPGRNGTMKYVDKNYKICSKDGTICQYGRIRPWRKYSVFTSSLFDGDKSMNYAFDLPLTVLAWHRLGYDCIVMIINDPWACKKDSKIHVLMETLLDMDGMVLLVLKGIPQYRSVTTSQVSRLFAATLVQDSGDPVVWNDTYIITSDADLWPLHYGFFDLPPRKDVLYGDLGTTRGVTSMPLSYIGMKVNTWNEVMSVGGKQHLPRDPGEVITYLQASFGKGCCTNTRHAGPGWTSGR